LVLSRFVAIPAFAGHPAITVSGGKIETRGMPAQDQIAETDQARGAMRAMILRNPLELVGFPRERTHPEIA
jgi:hypothetical protein